MAVTATIIKIEARLLSETGRWSVEETALFLTDAVVSFLFWIGVAGRWNVATAASSGDRFNSHDPGVGKLSECIFHVSVILVLDRLSIDQASPA